MKTITQTLALLTLILSFNVSALAMDLEEARSKNLVTELPTGYLKANDDKAKSLADEVNTKRKMAYEEIAKKNGLTLEQVSSQAAKKIAEKNTKGK